MSIYVSLCQMLWWISLDFILLDVTGKQTNTAGEQCRSWGEEMAGEITCQRCTITTGESWLPVNSLLSEKKNSEGSMSRNYFYSALGAHPV